MMGANESSENRTDEMNTLILECGLVDPHLMTDPFSETETYTRRKTKSTIFLPPQESNKASLTHRYVYTTNGEYPIIEP